MNTTVAAKQLERSERGQMTCKMLLDFLKSSTVQGLDGPNSEAVAFLVESYMIHGSACDVIDALQSVVSRNRWVNAQRP